MRHCRYLLVVLAPQVAEVCTLKNSATALDFNAEVVAQNYLFNLYSPALELGEGILDKSVLVGFDLVLGGLQYGDEALPFAGLAFGCEVGFGVLLVGFFCLRESDADVLVEGGGAAGAFDFGKEDGFRRDCDGCDILSAGEEDEAENRHYTYEIISRNKSLLRSLAGR